jgi:alkylmercury lyase
MAQITLDQVISAWATDREHTPQEQDIFNVQIKYHILQLLAQGQPVSNEQLAFASGHPLETIEPALRKLEADGCEFDGEGNLIGLELTLKPTPHHFYTNGNHLYAWCALDALFLPGLIGQTAEVESACPVTGKTIRLTVTPEGVTEVHPAETVVSEVLPGFTPSCTPSRKTGPGSASCSQTHFFSSRRAAETWLQDHPKIAILTLEEACQLARVIWIEPFIRALHAEA